MSDTPLAYLNYIGDFVGLRPIRLAHGMPIPRVGERVCYESTGHPLQRGIVRQVEYNLSEYIIEIHVEKLI